MISQGPIFKLTVTYAPVLYIWFCTCNIYTRVKYVKHVYYRCCIHITCVWITYVIYLKHKTCVTRSSRRQRPMNQKCNKSESKQAMERDFPEEPVEYGVLMCSHQLTQWMGWVQCPLNVFIMSLFCKITYKQH